MPDTTADLKGFWLGIIVEVHVLLPWEKGGIALVPSKTASDSPVSDSLLSPLFLRNQATESQPSKSNCKQNIEKAELHIKISP